MTRWHSLFCAVSVFASFVQAPAAQSDRASSLGLNVQQMDTQSIAHLRDIGVKHIRITLYWSLWRDSTYRREWTQALSRALESGLEPLVVVHQSPFGNFQTRRAVYRAFAQFMKGLAIEFPKVRAWQLWNEMDLAFTDIFGAGHPRVSLRQRGRYYGQMLNLAYPAIKEGSPGALVITGGIASGPEEGFLEGLYDSHAKFDVLAIHTYGYPLAQAFLERGRSARRIMRVHHDSRSLWNTEFGLESAVIPGASELTPAQVDSAHLDAWRATLMANVNERLYDRVYGFVLSDGRDLGFGLLRRDDSPRPAYSWLRVWLREARGRTIHPGER